MSTRNLSEKFQLMLRWVGFALVLLMNGEASCDNEGRFSGRPQWGRVAGKDDIGAFDWSIFPDGTGLPPGKGNVSAGKLLYEKHCEHCHGAQGTGASAEELVGREQPLTSLTPDKTVGNYWPYATTLFDFIRRSMPLDAPGSLDASAVYAITAYLLHLNGIVPGDTVLDSAGLRLIQMPNRDGFISHYPLP